MNISPFIPPSQPDQDLSEPQLIQTLRIITLALVSGPTMFLGVVALMTFTGEPSGEITSDLDFFLALVLGIWVALNLITKPVVEYLRKTALNKGTILHAYQTSHIIRMALAEGPALFGAIGLIIFAPKLEVMEHPKLALFLIPYLTLLVSAACHFPSKTKLEDFKAADVRAS